MCQRLPHAGHFTRGSRAIESPARDVLSLPVAKGHGRSVYGQVIASRVFTDDYTMTLIVSSTQGAAVAGAVAIGGR